MPKLIGVGVTCKEMLCFISVFDQINSYITYVLNLYKSTMMLMKCKYHETHITFGTEANGQT